MRPAYVSAFLSESRYTHADYSRQCGQDSAVSVCLSLFVFVRAVKRKRLELSIQKSVEIYSTTGPKHPLTLMSKGDRMS